MTQKAQEAYEIRKGRLAQEIEALPPYARQFVERYRPVVTQWCRLAGCCEQAALLEFVAKVRGLLDAQYDARFAREKVLDLTARGSGH